MSYAVRPSRSRFASFPHPHTRDQALTVATAVLAALSVVLLLARAYDVGAVVAAVCVATGGWSQMVSATTAERMETVLATVVGALALAACLAFGSGLPTY